tara:strand:+ start:1679 stop:2875 length:1197 start_codon:yes stop_codon:yes gene_type:complete
MNRGKTGGIKIKDSYEGSKDAAIDDFLKNSHIEFFNSGNFGLILKAKTNKGYDSPYESLRYNTLNKPVDVLLIKLLLIEDKEEDEAVTSPPVIMDKQFDSISSEDFQREVDIQREMFEKTNEKGDAICPSIIYDSADYDIDLLESSIKNDRLNQELTPLYELFSGEIGLIAMEILPNYNTIYNKKTEFLSSIDRKIAELFEKMKQDGKTELEIKKMYNETNLFEETIFKGSDIIFKDFALIIYELIRCYKIGYIHGDFHLNNILFNVKEKYIPSFLGKSLLIDFGYSFPVPQDKRDLSTNEEIINTLLDTINPFYEFAPITFISYQWLNYINSNYKVRTKVFEYLDIVEKERKESDNITPEMDGGRKRHKNKTLKKHKKNKNKTKRAPFYFFPFLARK